MPKKLLYKDIIYIYVYILQCGIRSFMHLCIYMCIYVHIKMPNTHFYLCVYIYIYRVSQEECARIRKGVPYAKIYRYNPKHLCPKWNGYGDNGQRSLKL